MKLELKYCILMALINVYLRLLTFRNLKSALQSSVHE